MKRQNITLYFFLVLGLVAIISIYIANQSLNETLKKTEEEKVKLQFQGRSYRGQKSPIATRKRDKLLKEAEKQKAIPKAEEIDLQQITDDYVYVEEKAEDRQKDIASEEVPEEATSEETQFHIQPSAEELRELKSKGIIIY